MKFASYVTQFMLVALTATSRYYVATILPFQVTKYQAKILKMKTLIKFSDAILVSLNKKSKEKKILHVLIQLICG